MFMIFHGIFGSLPKTNIICCYAPKKSMLERWSDSQRPFDRGELYPEKWENDPILTSIFFPMGVSLNGGTPKTPQNDHF